MHRQPTMPRARLLAPPRQRSKLVGVVKSPAPHLPGASAHLSDMDVPPVLPPLPPIPAFPTLLESAVDAVALAGVQDENSVDQFKAPFAIKCPPAERKRQIWHNNC